MILIIIVTLSILVNIRAFFKCLQYKLKYKEKALFFFFPFIGFFGFNYISYLLTNDVVWIDKYIAKKYPKAKIIVSNLLLDSSVILLDSNLIREFNLRQNQFTKLKIVPKIANVYKGVAFSEGADWKRQRQILSKCFTFDELRKVTPEILNISQKFILSNPLENQQVKMVDYFEQLIGQLIIETFFGNFEEMKIDSSRFIECIYLFEDFVTYGLNLYYSTKCKLLKDKTLEYFPTKFEKQLNSRMKFISETARKLILIKVKEHQEEKDQEKKYKYFIDVYIDYFIKNNIIIDENVIEEIFHQFMTIFIAGVDSTANLLSVITYQLAIRPHYQEIIRKELSQLDLDNLEITMVQNLTKTNSFFNEVLRMYSPGPNSLVRIALEEVKIEEFTFPKGEIIWSSLINMCYNQKYYKNPEEFNIERWENEKPDVKNFLPFSGGPRNCIGQHLALLEIKIVLARLLRTYELVKIEGKTPKVNLKLATHYVDDNLVKFKKI